MATILYSKEEALDVILSMSKRHINLNLSLFVDKLKQNMPDNDILCSIIELLEDSTNYVILQSDSHVDRMVIEICEYEDKISLLKMAIKNCS